MIKPEISEVTSIVLRPYQAEAHAAAWDAYEQGVLFALIVMATGLGKTFTAAWFALQWLRANPGKRVVFLVDTVEATKQGRKEFAKMFGDEFSTGIRCGRIRENLDADMLFSTFGSMRGLLGRKQVNPEDVGLVIVDESHHASANTYKPIIKAFKNAFFYGMTATPDRADNRNIRDLFGEEVYSFPLRQALAEGEWLAPVTYNLMKANFNVKKLQEFQKRVEEGDRTISIAEIDQALFLESKLEEVVEEIQEHQDESTRTVVFCANIPHAKQVAEMLPGARAYYSGQRYESEDDDPLKQFRSGKLRTIVVVNKLNEAVDVPEADLIVFLRSTASYRIWAQQLGRGLRKAIGKSGVKILDFAGSCKRVIMVKRLFERGPRRRNGGSGGSGPGIDVGPPEWIDMENIQVEFEEELINLVNLLGSIDHNSYETIEEAMEAVQRLDPVPKTGPEYQKLYIQDRRLPSNPYLTYKDSGWENWPEYLGTAPYKTIKEAMEAVQRLDPVPTTGPAYRASYRQNSRLRARPQDHYPDTWRGNLHFLGVDAYDTIEEAMEAVQRLNPVPRNSTEYGRVYLQDKHLKSSPHRTYKNKGWVDWPHFVGEVK